MIAVWKHLSAYAQNLSDDLRGEACKQEQVGRRVPQFMEAEHRERYLAQKILQRRRQAIRGKCHSILGADHQITWLPSVIRARSFLRLSGGILL